VSVIEERKQGVKKKSFMVRDRNMYFFIYIPLEKRIFNHRKNEPFTYPDSGPTSLWSHSSMLRA
jgi:hypothetical protein